MSGTLGGLVGVHLSNLLFSLLILDGISSLLSGDSSFSSSLNLIGLGFSPLLSTSVHKKNYHGDFENEKGKQLND